MMITLKQAQEQGKIDQFIAEHERSDSGDEAAFEATLKNLAQSPKLDRKTSSQDKSDG
jgi:hypothetical protein